MICRKTKHCYPQTQHGEPLPCAYCHPEAATAVGLSIRYFIGGPDGEWVKAWVSVDLKREVG
jgi:hypothetical protein